MRKYLHKMAIIAVIFSLSSTVVAAQLKILVVVSQSAENVFSGATTFANIEDFVGDVFEEEAGLTRPVFALSTLRPSFNEHFLNESALLPLLFLPSIETERQNHAADLVLLVLLSTNAASGTTCGGAPGVGTHTPDYLPDLANGYFVYNKVAKHGAYVTLLHDGCSSLTAEVQAAHEVGHLLFLEHEVTYDENGLANDEVGSNGNPDKPFMTNHPMVTGLDQTIMFSGGPSTLAKFFSQVGKKFLDDTDASNLNADAAGIIGGTTYDYVAKYKEPLPPPPPSCGPPNIIVTPLECGNYYTRTFLITGNLPGYQITSARYEVKVGSYGIWQIILDGILSCPLFNSGYGFYVKMFFTTPQGTAVCQKYVSFPSCGGGGGGDPPIQPW